MHPSYAAAVALLVLALTGCEEEPQEPPQRLAADPAATLRAAQDRMRADDSGAFAVAASMTHDGETYDLGQEGEYRISTPAWTAHQDLDGLGIDYLGVGPELWFVGDDAPDGCWLQIGLAGPVVQDGEPVDPDLELPPVVRAATEAVATGGDGAAVTATTALDAVLLSLSQDLANDVPEDRAEVPVVLDLADGRLTGWHTTLGELVDAGVAAGMEADDFEGFDADSEVAVSFSDPGRDVELVRPPDEDIALMAMDNPDPHLAECLGMSS